MSKHRIFVVAAIALAAACGTKTTVPTRTAPGPTPVVSTARIAQGIDLSAGLQRDTLVAAALADIDPSHIHHTDSMLVSFGTRNTFSDTMSTTHGIGAARRWIHSQFDQYSRDCGGCLKVEYYGKVQDVRRAAGRDTTHVVVMTGHYDSCVCSVGGSFDSTSTAPGADDDGSGTSAVVELARVFSRKYPKGLNASILFVAVAAEEQGLYGSRQLAERLHEQGYKVVAGMTDDIVGNTTAEDGSTDSTSMRIFAADPDNSPNASTSRATRSSRE